jgi:hypothetical protein
MSVALNIYVPVLPRVVDGDEVDAENSDSLSIDIAGLADGVKAVDACDGGEADKRCQFSRKHRT